MVTVADLRTRIKSDIVINGTVYDAQIDDAIRSALRTLRGKRYWFLEKVGQVTLASGATSVAMPTDFGAHGEFEIIASGNRKSNRRGFDFKSFSELKKIYWQNDPVPTGEPVACALVDETLYVSHTADKAYTIPITYFRKDASLPAASQISVWFDDGYDVVRSLAAFIFKRECKEYPPSEEDGGMAQFYLEALNREHERRLSGV